MVLDPTDLVFLFLFGFFFFSIFVLKLSYAALLSELQDQITKYLVTAGMKYFEKSVLVNLKCT